MAIPYSYTKSNRSDWWTPQLLPYPPPPPLPIPSQKRKKNKKQILLLNTLSSTKTLSAVGVYTRFSPKSPSPHLNTKSFSSDDLDRDPILCCLGDVLGQKFLILGFHHLVRFAQVDPQLQAMWRFFSMRHFTVNDASSCCHPLKYICVYS